MANDPVIFDYTAWSLRYPELAAWVSPTLAGNYFSEAGLYCNNSNTSLIPSDNGVRGMILNMLTAHIAALNAPLGGQDSSPLVGRINNATEGSVSVQADLQVPMTAAWFSLTKYGLAAWQAILPYRSARYFPAAPQRWNGLGWRW